jgi:Uncharacterised protein family (UPF0158)
MAILVIMMVKMRKGGSIMTRKVKLATLVDEMQVQFDEVGTYLHLESGSIVSIANHIFVKAEDEEPIEELEDWEQTEYTSALDILNNPDQYLELPDKYEINEYRMMENFCYFLEDEHAKELLSSAIRGRGAFRRFKDQAIALRIIEDWYSFRDESYKDFAIKWCEMNEVDYE